MLPYLEWRVIQLGPINLQVWGMFVGLGFLLGAVAAAWLAKRRGQDSKLVFDILPWLIFAGIVGGRLGHVFFYDWSYFAQHPLEIFAVWQGGASIFGGLIACLAVGIWYLRRRQLDVMAYADTLIFGLPFGLWIGRIGCFLIHDHPGTATDFVLGVKYPDGIVRHDHGLYLSINGFLMAMTFLWLARKPRPVGLYLAIFAIWYGVVRFGLDFYRVADTKYAGLTPAQYFCVALVAAGVGVLVWINKRLKRG
ncbi:MAG: prolipoprotein diacylglyceryl transferase [Patescibacteria group bacterium]